VPRKRKKKSAYAKLRAKANKAVAKKVKSTRKAISKATRRVERKLASNSLAKAGRRQAKRARRAAKRAARAAARQAQKQPKKTLRAARKAIKAAKKQIRQAKRNRREKEKRRKATTRAANRARREREKQFNKLAITGEADLSGAVVRDKTKWSPGASKPGEPPRRRTGKGWQSITAELRMKGKKPEARTFVDKKIAPYMAMWEFRPDDKQRPFLKPAVNDNITLLGREIGDSLRQTLRPQAGKKKAKVT